MPVLTGIDVLGIQRYVFASNRLRDSVAASWLVHWATVETGALNSARGQVLQTGGGNVLLLFPDLPSAQNFASRYTRCLQEQAPGLEVVLAHRTYAAQDLARAVRQLQVDLAIAKLERLPCVPQLGLSVTAACAFTGLPATRFDLQDPNTPLSPMVAKWRDPMVRKCAAARWGEFLDCYEQYAFPSDLDDMGRTHGDTSLIGVVHVDGNAIGQQITEWLKKSVEAEASDDRVRDELVAWSSAIERTGTHGLRSVVERVIGAISGLSGASHRAPRLIGAVSDLAFDLKRDDEGKVLLPIRPVLLGGDDLTFLCDGRIALDLAQTALQAFVADIPYLGPITACAGVAIVPAHAPFDQAYALAAQLANNAKSRRQEMDNNECWIDWHVGTTQSGEGIGALRDRAYRHALSGIDFKLTCRPYRLGESAKDQETWRWLSETVLGTSRGSFRSEEWRKHRNKLKELTSLLAEGPAGIKRARQAWTAAGQLAWPDGLDEDHGFLDGVRTPLLDALELLDIHLTLSCEEVKS